MVGIPMVIKKTAAGERSYDIYSRLLEDRIIFVNSEIDEESANAIVASLLHLASEDPIADIYMYISSPGGSIVHGLGIYDTMNYIKPDVSTICVGEACSMGAFLLSAGTKGKRLALPNSRIMIHKASGGFSGKADDVEVYAEELLRLNSKMYNLLSKHTGRSLEEIKTAVAKDYFMTPEVAKDFGMIDEIITNAPSEE